MTLDLLEHDHSAAKPSSWVHCDILPVAYILLLSRSNSTLGAGTRQAKCPHNHMWNTLARVCVSVCVGQTEPGEGREGGKRRSRREEEAMEENLGQTGAEPHLKRWRRRVRPVRNQHEGSGWCGQPMRRGLGGGGWAYGSVSVT